MASETTPLANEDEQAAPERVVTLSLLPKNEFSKIGFLNKLGHVVPNWLERFFALQPKHKELLYFKDYGAYKHYIEDPLSHRASIQGSIHLLGATLFLAFYAEKNCTFELDALDENRKERHFYLSAGDRDSMHHWMKKLTQAGVTYVSPIANAKELRYMCPPPEGPSPRFGMQGFLDKRGFVFNKGFKERFFRVEHTLGSWVLAYYKRYDERKALGVIPLRGAELLDNIRDNKDENPACQFTIQPVDNSRVYVLRTQTIAEKNIWLRVLPMFIALKDSDDRPIIENWAPRRDTDATDDRGSFEVPEQRDHAADMRVLDSSVVGMEEEHKSAVRSFVKHPSTGAPEASVSAATSSYVPPARVVSVNQQTPVVVAKAVPPATVTQQADAPKGGRTKRAPSMVRPPSADKHELRYVDVLAQGAVFAKHGHDGFPHKKFVFLHESNARLYWLDPKQSREYMQKNKSLFLHDVTDVIKGKQTAVFQRWTATTAKPECCFSLNAGKRTLDLEAESEEQRNQWVEAVLSIKAKLGQAVNAIEQQ